MKKDKVKIEGDTISGTAESILNVLDHATKKAKGRKAKSVDDFSDDEYEIDETISIMSANIKDGICNYSYTILEGIGLGDTHGVDGTNLCKDALLNAFAKFHVHMACIDDVYKHADIQFPDINKMHGDEYAMLYHCTGFMLSGTEENLTVILKGNKYVSIGGRIEFKTHKILLEEGTGYKWYKELKEAIEDARREVNLYRSGKYELAEQEDEKENEKQTKLKFQPEESKEESQDEE